MANQTIRPLIEEAVKVSMKNRDKEITSTLRMAISELKKEEIDKRIDLEDEQVIQILQRMIKQRKDSYSQFSDAGRNELAEKETDKDDKQLLRRLHVKDNDKVLEGAEAFLYVWQKIPKYRFLYKFFKLPIIFTIFNYGYEIVAYFLYLKNKKQLKN